LRSRVNTEHPTDDEALYQHWKKIDSIPNNWPIISPVLNLISSYLALDVLKVLVGSSVSAVLGRVMYIDFSTLESSFHEILKIPRCPDCSRGRDRPLNKIWDIGMKVASPDTTS
jgi:bacteriocin biosynthesis cyclodehydratase domain-containing protein